MMIDGKKFVGTFDNNKRTGFGIQVSVFRKKFSILLGKGKLECFRSQVISA
jgi:hypothetical protein